MTPERVEQLKNWHALTGYTHSENEHYHMFDAPTGNWCVMYSKKDGTRFNFDPTRKVRLHSSK